MKTAGRWRLAILPAFATLACLLWWWWDVGGVRLSLRENALDKLLPLLADEQSEPVLVVVDIDSDTLGVLGHWPWPRERLALLLDAVVGAGPAAIGLDILLDGTGQTAQADAALAASLAKVPSVLGLVLDEREPAAVLHHPQILVRGSPSFPEIWTARSVAGPAEPIVSASAGAGAMVLLPDGDGRIRRVPLLVQTEDGFWPGLAVDLARVALGASGYIVEADPPALHVGPLLLPLDPSAHLRLIPTTEAHWTRRTVSAAAIMADPAIAGRLAGQVVLIGSSAPEIGGLRVTALSPATPSVQMQADAMEMIARGITPTRHRFAGLMEATAAAVLACAVAFLALRLPPASGALVTLGIALFWFCASAGSYAWLRALIDPAGPAVLAMASFGFFSLAAHADNLRRAHALRQQFEQHLAPEVVRRLVENPELMRLEGESREITALFTDIEGFTSMTERAEADKLVALLNGYLDAVTQVVVAHGGMVEKIVGDGVHAIFNAPLDLPEHPRRAVDCAGAILAISEAFRRQPMAQELGLGRTRIGIETGMVIVGDVGGRSKLDYTAYGTAMNTASRLEAANKELGSSICIGPVAASRVAPGILRSLGMLAVRGLAEPVEVFTPVALSE